MLKRLSLFFATLFLLGACTVTHAQTATITGSGTHQTIDGFGAADAFCVSESGYDSCNLTDAQADLFFSATAPGGVGLSILRAEVPDDGSCSGTCTINGTVTMTKAIARGAKVMATPWSPPASMESNSSIVCGSLNGGSYSAYATYLKNYVQQLQSTFGISLYALSVQNEPDFCATYDSAIWSAANFDTFIKTNLGPTFASAGLTTKIMLPEPGHSSELTSYADTTMTDGTAAAYVGIVATHDYDSAGVANPVNYTTGGKPLWETEVSDFGSPDATITSGLLYAKEIHDWLTQTSMQAWIAWWMVNINGNNDNEGLIQADGTITKRLYAIGNWAKFCRPGSTRIDATVNPQSGIFLTACKQGSNFSTIAINTNGSPVSQTFNLAGGLSASAMTPYVTSASLNLAQQSNVTVSSGSFTSTLAAHSVTTFASIAAGGGSCSATSTLWVGVLDNCRGIDWTKAGIPGGLPDGSWMQCGSIVNPTGGDDTTNIQAALNACTANHFVKLAAGTFSTTGVTFPRNTTGHIVIRGNGGNSTFINYFSGVNCNGTSAAICILSNDGTFPGMVSPTTTTWTSGYSKGTTQVTLGSVAGIVVNQTVLVFNQCDTGYSGSACTTGSATDNNGYFICSTPWTVPGQGCNLPMFQPDGSTWRSNAWEMEAAMVTAINAGGCGATCVTLSQAIQHPNWSSGQSPQAVLIQPIPQDGVENLSLDGSGAGSTDDCIGGQDTWQLFISGVRCVNAHSRGFFLLDSFHSLIQNNYIAHANTNFNSNTGTNGYGDGMGIRINWGADDLIQNNIVQQWKVSFVNDGPSPSDVLGYNYFIDQDHRTSEDDFMWGGTFQHATGDDFQLFEGNAMNQSQDDNIHGGHVNQTRLRNFFWGYEQCANGQCGSFTSKTTSETAIISSSTSRYSAFVGNILGTPGFTTIYLNSAVFGSGQAFQVGGGNPGTMPALPNDPLAISTSLFWDNWDVVNGTVCDNAQVPIAAPTYPNAIPTLGCGGGTLPTSFYLTSKPAWFGSIAWPPIGPDVTGGNIGQCNGSLNVTGRFNGLAATNTSQCAGSTKVTAWGGHVNEIPAQHCAIEIMGIPLDGTGSVKPFDANTCYAAGLAGANTPTFSPSSGAPPQTVTISDSSSGSIVCYNTTGSPGPINGSASCPAGSTIVSGTISVASTETLYAVAGGPLYSDSAISSASYAPAGTPSFVLTCPGSCPSFNFGSIAVGSGSLTQLFTLSNPGSASLVLTLPFGTSGGNAADFTIIDNPCASTFGGIIAGSGGSCTFTVEFTPTLAIPETTSLVFTDNAGNHSFTLSGTGTGGPPPPTGLSVIVSGSATVLGHGGVQ